MSTVEVVKMTGLLELSVNQLRFDTDVQCRASIDSGTVTEYKEALTANVVFPPLVVFHDGKTYWVADGFHRGSAYRESGATKCPCDVRQGTKRDAILYACGANGKHGLPRTNLDKRRAVLTLLKDAEWRQKPSRWIAEKCGVGYSLVQEIKNETAQLTESVNSQPARVTGSDGKSYLAKRKPAETKPVEKAEAKLEPKPGKVRPAPVGGMASLVGELIREDQEEEEEGETPRPNIAESKEASDVIALAKAAMKDLWSRCPVSFRWRLVACLENELSDLKEGLS